MRNSDLQTLYIGNDSVAIKEEYILIDMALQNKNNNILTKKVLKVLIVTSFLILKKLFFLNLKTTESFRKNRRQF